MDEVLLKYKIDKSICFAARMEIFELIINAEKLKITQLECSTLCKFYLDINDLTSRSIKFDAPLLDDVTNLNKWVLSINFTESFMQSHYFRSFLLMLIQNKTAWILWLCYKIVVIKNAKKSSADVQYLVDLSHYLLIPLCSYLGLVYFKSCFEDETFRLEKPKIYFAIKSQVEALNASRDDTRCAIDNELKTIVQRELNINIQPSSRTKTLFGIHNKMDRKCIMAKTVYDHIAFRIMAESQEQCYELISIIHKFFKPVPGEYDDYISNPKSNGYQSIHTAVLHSSGTHFEVQVRTKNMHNRAEYGVAAHWVYKESQLAGGEWLSKLLQWEPGNEGGSVNSMFDSSKVFVLTPKGEVVALPKGSTGIDAAYAIHTQIGNTIKSIMVNGSIKPLSYNLQTGDTIKIITSQFITPSLDWLNKTKGLVKTTKATRCIQKWFYQATTKQLPEKVNSNVSKEVKVKSISAKAGQKREDNLIVQGLSHLAYKLAKCCQPAHSDSIVVNITRKRGLMVHKECCSNMYSICPNRRFNAAWK